MSRGWSLPICLLTILSISGWAWSQAGKTFQEEPEKPFLKPYSPESNNQSLDVSLKTNTINNNKRNIDKTSIKAINSPTTKSSKPTLGHHQKSVILPDSQKISVAGSSMSFQGYNQNHTAGTVAFLDGYLLKSLQDKRIVRKKADNESSDDNQFKKNKGAFVK